MDQKFRTSFIPKQEVIRTEPRMAGGFRFSIFSIVALTVFGVSCLLAIIAFIYQHSLISSINKMNAELVATGNSFDSSTIDAYIKLDKQIEAGKKILAGHNAFSPVLKLLERQTLTGVRFKNFEFIYDSNGKMNVAMSGEARNFLTIASQSDLWSGEHRIINPIFNDLDLNDKQMAKFSFKSSLDTQLFLYKDNYVGKEEATSTLVVPVGVEEEDIKIIPIDSNRSGGILPSDNN